jgi:hypothetical protein
MIKYLLKKGGLFMKFKKLQVLTLVSLMMLSTNLYASPVNSVETLNTYMEELTDDNVIVGGIVPGEYDNIIIGGRASEDQTLTDTDGDGYFAFKIPSATTKGRFSLRNDGKARVDVTVHSADTDEIVWSARVNAGSSATSASGLSLDAGKYYFTVVSDDGGPLNVTCSARY